MAALRGDIERSPYQRVAVGAFADAPGAAGSGRLAAVLFARQLKGAGFVLVEPEDHPDLLLSGAVTEYSLTRRSQPVYINEDSGAGIHVYGPPDYFPLNPGVGRVVQNEMFAVCSLSVRLAYASNGAPMWVGYGASKLGGASAQAAAESAVQKASERLFRDLSKHREWLSGKEPSSP